MLIECKKAMKSQTESNLTFSKKANRKLVIYSKANLLMSRKIKSLQL